LAASFRKQGQALLHSLAAGKEEALDGFHRLWGAPLRHYLDTRFRSLGVSVDDVYQETLIKVWGAAEHYDRSEGSPSTWVFAIARNCAIDHLRKDAALKARLDRAFVAFAREHTEFVEYRAKTQDALISSDLSSLQRTVVEADLNSFPDQDDARLAARLETSCGSVQAQRSRAYKRLGHQRLKRRDALAWLGNEGDPSIAKLLGWRPDRQKAGVKK
jgi:RNA polymerase sigma-70 factor (ECF subfamily)